MDSPETCVNGEISKQVLNAKTTSDLSFDAPLQLITDCSDKTCKQGPGTRKDVVSKASKNNTSIKQAETRPDRKCDEAGVQGEGRPCLQQNAASARLRFRWKATKGLPGHILVVHLRVPFSQKLLALKWKKQDEIFESEPCEVECGVYKCTMIVAGRELEIEPLDVKFYTFECDVYLLEREETKLYEERKILAEEVQGKRRTRDEHNKGNSADRMSRDVSTASKKTDTGSDTVLNGVLDPKQLKINLDDLNNNGTENRVKRQASPSVQQVGGSAEDDGLDLPMFKIPPKFSKFSKKRSNSMDSDTGDSEAKHGSPCNSSGIRRSRVYEKLLKEQLKMKTSNEGKDVPSSGIQQRDGSREQPLRSPDPHDSRQGYIEDKYRDNRYRKEGHAMNGRSEEWSSRNGDAASRLWRAGAAYSSEQQLYRHAEQAPYRSDFGMRRSTDSIHRAGREETAIRTDALHSVHRLTDTGRGYGQEQKTRTASRDDHVPKSRDRHAPESYDRRTPDSDHVRYHSHSGKESGYYSDSGYRGRYDNRYESRDRYHSDGESREDALNKRALSVEQRGGDEREAGTHDRERGPHIRPPLRTARSTPLAVNFSTNRQETQPEKTQRERMQDLEETVLSLKRVLDERERELNEFQAKTRSLEADLSRERARPQEQPTFTTHLETREETEKRINDLIREKENMATEIWQLKRDLEKVAQSGRLHEELGSDMSSHLDAYDPENPHILKRNIDDLESQLKDLQEVNETTANNLIRTEKELDQLKKENEALRKSRNRRIIELEDELRACREKGGGSGDYLRRETDQLREDLRILRDKNHQLVQDNIKLTEHLKDLEVRSSNSRHGADDENEMRARCERYRKEREAALEEVHFLRKQLHMSRREDNLSRISGKDYKSEVYADSKQHLTTYDSKQNLSSHDSTSRPLLNGFSDESRNRDRKYSGSDVSDSTAVLTSMAPTGYHGNKEAAENRVLRRSHDAGHSGQPTSSDRYDDIDRNNSLGSRQATDTVEDVLDDYPIPHARVHYMPNIVEDELDSDDEHLNTDFIKQAHADYNINTKFDHMVSRPIVTSKNNQPIEHDSARTAHPAKAQNAHPDLQSGQKNTLGNSEKGKLSFSDSLALFDIGRPVDTSSARCSQAYTFTCESVSPSTVLAADAPSKHQNTSCCLDELSDVEDSVSCVGMKKAVMEQKMDPVTSSPSQFRVIHPPEYPTGANFANLKRSSSVGSDCTDLILGDAEQLVTHLTHPVSESKFSSVTHPVKEYSMSMHNLSTATMDRHQSTKDSYILQHQSKANERMPSPPPSEMMNSALRSVSPRPAATQHNKHLLSQSLEDTSFTANRRPFCPRAPADLNIGDIVKFSRQGGKISRGCVKYIGHLPGKHDTYLGIELEHEMGKHDGTYEKTRYFNCKPNKGVFVAYSKVVMAWGS